jgi:two-component system, OmpR family, sensor histidine kinase KdpD
MIMGVDPFNVPQTVSDRPNPDELLRQVEAEEALDSHGRLKIFLGYYSGVGKSFRMLDEGRRRHERGQDVVVGAIQPTERPEVEALLQNLEVIPERIVNGVPVMDTEAILVRHPGVCLVDGLAYDNPPGSKNEKRWQDVQELLDARISVITTINLIYIEEQRERVQQITGKRVSQTVPQKFIQTADEIVLVDAPPELCIDQASPNSAKLGEKLSELREMALVLAADVIDRQLEGYLERSGIKLSWGAQERILVCLTPRANGEQMIASGQRNADRFHGELFAVYVNQPEITPEDQSALDRNLDLARNAGAKVETLDGEDPVDAILRFARSHGITQIFLGHSKRHGMLSRLARNPVDRLLDKAEDIDVRVFPN